MFILMLHWKRIYSCIKVDIHVDTKIIILFSLVALYMMALDLEFGMWSVFD